MAQSSSASLDPSIFNDSLYTSIRSTWFAGLPSDAKRMNDITAKRWWGKGATEEEKTAFDEELRAKYAPALEAIAPGKLVLPEWKGYAAEAGQDRQICDPLLREVELAKKQDGEKGALTLLSLVLLLDQVSRNIYRDPAGLRLVYGHYDRLAWTLIHASSTLVPDPKRHAFFRGNPAWAAWLSLPLMHAEDRASQELCMQETRRLAREAEEDGDGETAEHVLESVGFAQRHGDIVERFGRFPHRNGCLGRRFTAEEEEWLRESGETFGVRVGGVSEEGEKGKSEL